MHIQYGQIEPRYEYFNKGMTTLVSRSIIKTNLDIQIHLEEPARTSATTTEIKS